MPPRVIKQRGGRAVVSQTHPAATAAAAAAAAARVGASAEKINGGKVSASTRDSPLRAAKTLAQEKISEMCHHTPRAAVAEEAPDDAEDTPGVSIDLAAAVAGAAKSPPPAVLNSPPALPPLWNAWWCGDCTVLHFVGDGGELEGPCQMCQATSPKRNHVMLDPDEQDRLRRTPGLSYTVLNHLPPSTSHMIGKTSGLLPADDSSKKSSSSSSVDLEDGLGLKNWSDDEDDGNFLGKTDHEVSKYSFFDRLEHYMDGELIVEENRKSVELAVMVEAGANVREMGTMTKELRANRFHSEYISILNEIPDSRFGEEGLRMSMTHRFKGMRKGEMTAENLLRKYEGELTGL